jgi:hypothetical protein
MEYIIKCYVSLRNFFRNLLGQPEPHCIDLSSSLKVTGISNEKYRDPIQRILQNIYKREPEDLTMTQTQTPTQTPIQTPIQDHAPFYVVYTLDQTEYYMYVTNINDLKLIEEPHIMSKINMITNAFLVKNNGVSFGVTEILQKFQGPDSNFYKNISGVSYELGDMIRDLKDYRELVIYTLLGDIPKVITLGPTFEGLDVRHAFNCPY